MACPVCDVGMDAHAMPRNQIECLVSIHNSYLDDWSNGQKSVADLESLKRCTQQLSNLRREKLMEETVILCPD